MHWKERAAHNNCDQIRKMCIVHTSNFAHLEIHAWEWDIGMIKEWYRSTIPVNMASV